MRMKKSMKKKKPTNIAYCSNEKEKRTKHKKKTYAHRENIQMNNL